MLRKVLPIVRNAAKEEVRRAVAAGLRAYVLRKMERYVEREKARGR